MPSRAELELRAASLNIAAASYPNDSTLEHAILRAQRALTASGAATTLLPSATSKAAIADGTVTAVS